MDAQTKRVLEYEKVLALAAKEAHWEPGAKLVYELLPCEDLHEVNYRQQQVAEARRFGSFDFGFAYAQDDILWDLSAIYPALFKTAPVFLRFLSDCPDKTT